MDKKSTDPIPENPLPAPPVVEAPTDPFVAALPAGKGPPVDRTRVELPSAFGIEDPTAERGDTDLESSSATPDQSPSARSKVTMLGDFLLVKKLGEGGMGAVYQAHQVSLDRDVAIKVLSSHLAKDPKFLERFQREARMMAKLDHPNILRCYFVGEAHGYHYLALELATGGSLESWLRQLEKLSVGDSLHIILAAAAGLQHAHEHDLIHRDIKPDNILINSKGIVKVADLGLVKAMSDDVTLTRSGTGVGTPVYMSMEQMRDAKHVDGRSDIYALGCMLYRCITGRPPFQGDTYIELFEAKKLGKYPPARRSNADVPGKLDIIIGRMLENDPKYRFQTCAELIEQLHSVGLANPSLSFIENAATVSVPPAGPASGIRRTQTKPTPAPSAERTPAPQPIKLEPELWYVRALNFDGVRRLTRKEVLQLIQQPNFDLKAEGCRSSKGPFQPLASFREFEPTLRANAARQFLDQKAARYKSQMSQILKEEEQHQQEREFRHMVRRFRVWIGPLIGLAVLSGLGYLAYWAIKTFLAPQ